MKNTKRLLMLTIALIMMFALVACGGDTTPSDDTTPPTTDASSGDASDPTATPMPDITTPPEPSSDTSAADPDIPKNGTPPNVSAPLESHRGDQAYFYVTSDDYIVFVRDENGHHNLKESGLSGKFYTVTSYDSDGKPDLEGIRRKIVFNNDADAETFVRNIETNTNNLGRYARIDNVVYLIPQDGETVVIGGVDTFYKEFAVRALADEMQDFVIYYHISKPDSEASPTLTTPVSTSFSGFYTGEGISISMSTGAARSMTFYYLFYDDGTVKRMSADFIPPEQVLEILENSSGGEIFEDGNSQRDVIVGIGTYRIEDGEISGSTTPGSGTVVEFRGVLNEDDSLSLIIVQTDGSEFNVEMQRLTIAGAG